MERNYTTPPPPRYAAGKAYKYAKGIEDNDKRKDAFLEEISFWREF